MTGSGRVSVALAPHEVSQLRLIVESGEFASIAAVTRAALQSWLRRRALHGGRHGAESLVRGLDARRGPAAGEIMERVELLFDAADAKA
ncbi:MAG TPA: hypothetical protein VMU93_10095 [Caulobacteraceae bacterium]|nr:hypothetical protein [Caulobacteraceae bacterium]